MGGKSSSKAYIWDTITCAWYTSHRGMPGTFHRWRGAGTRPSRDPDTSHKREDASGVFTVAVTLSQSVTKARNPSPNRVPAVL